MQSKARKNEASEFRAEERFVARAEQGEQTGHAQKIRTQQLEEF